MATRNYTVTIPQDKNQRSVYGALLIEWTGLLNGDEGEPFDLCNYNEKTVQVLGTQGTGGNCRIEGTNVANSTTAGDYAALADKQGNALNVGAPGVIEAIQENPLRIRPRVTAGDGTTNYAVRMLVHSNRS